VAHRPPGDGVNTGLTPRVIDTMIVFDLACSRGHAFEGWFASADAYADQRARGLVRCPMCDDAAIDKRPSARVNSGKSRNAVEATTSPATPPAPAGEDASAAMNAIAGLPPEMLAKLREIVRNTENVGEKFAEEARKIHYQEAPARAIRGKATPDEAEALREEGIEFSSLPAMLTVDKH
jgi:hypothetical protein